MNLTFQNRITVDVLTARTVDAVSQWIGRHKIRQQGGDANVFFNGRRLHEQLRGGPQQLHFSEVVEHIGEIHQISVVLLLKQMEDEHP